jgi:hypothetical protein
MSNGYRWTPEGDALLRKFWAEGKSDRDLAYILGCDRTTVHRRRKRLKLPSRCKGGRARGFKHTAEWKARKAEEMRRRWQENPEMANRVFPNLRLGPAAFAAQVAFAPPRGTPEFRLYKKLQRNVGTEAARKEMGI